MGYRLALLRFYWKTLLPLIAGSLPQVQIKGGLWPIESAEKGVLSIPATLIVIQHSGCDGDNHLSLRRALARVKCQLILAWTALRCVSHAVIVRCPG
jgi:hypothetical protein